MQTTAVLYLYDRNTSWREDKWLAEVRPKQREAKQMDTNMKERQTKKEHNMLMRMA